MKRPVIVWVDDPDVTELGIQELDIDAGRANPTYYLPVPPDDPLRDDVDLLTDLLLRIEEEDGYHDPVHDAVCKRLRARFNLDRGDDDG